MYVVFEHEAREFQLYLTLSLKSQQFHSLISQEKHSKINTRILRNTLLALRTRTQVQSGRIIDGTEYDDLLDLKVTSSRTS